MGLTSFALSNLLAIILGDWCCHCQGSKRQESDQVWEVHAEIWDAVIVWYVLISVTGLNRRVAELAKSSKDGSTKDIG
jgi:hypothetical protein